MPFSTRKVLTSRRLDNGRWELSFEASMPLASLREVSTFRVENGTVLPMTYRFERRVVAKSKQVEHDFDWTEGQVRGSDRGEPVRLALSRGMQDKGTYQLALQADVAAGEQGMSYQVIDGDEIEVYDFRVLGEERVETRMGSINAIKVERVRDPAQSSRKTVLWFAKDWDYLVVRLQQVEKDGKEYQIMLKDGTVNGRTVEGIKD